MRKALAYRSIERQDLFLLLLIAAFTISISFALWSNLNASSEQRIYSNFENHAANLLHSIDERVELYQYGVRGARGAATVEGLGNLTREDFAVYSRTRDIDQEFPGARGFGIIYRVSKNQSQQFEAAMAAEYGEEINIRYLNPNDSERFVIRYIEPLDRNKAAVGLDIASETNRRVAALRAAQTGLASLTGPIAVVQDTEKNSSAFLLLLPIYQQGMALQTAQERLQATEGWAYSVLLFREIIQSIDTDHEQLAFSIRDVTEDEKSIPFYLSKGWTLGNDEYQIVDRLNVFGRDWEITVKAHPGLLAGKSEYNLISLAILLVVINVSFIALVLFFIIFKNRRNLEREEQNALTSSLIEASPTGNILVNSKGEIIRANRRLRDLFAYTMEELKGKSIEQIIPAISAKDYLQHRDGYFGEIINTGISGNVYGLRSDNSQFPVEINLSSVEINGEKCIIGGVNDITERLQFIEKLRQSEQSWRDLANALPQLIWTCDEHGSLDFLSEQWKLLTPSDCNLSGAQLFEELIHPDDREEVLAMLRNSVGEGRRIRTECRIRDFNGDYSWFDIQQIPVMNDKDQITHWIGSGTNIDARRNAETQIRKINNNLETLVEEKTQELGKARQSLDNILNAVPSMIGYWNRDLLCRFANQPLQAFLGKLPSQPVDGVQLPSYDALFGLDSPHVQRALSGHLTRFETELMISGQDTSFFDVHYIPDVLDGHVDGFFVLMQEITEIRKAQIKAESISKQKSDFLAVMSHEIRTPLNGILGFAGLLSEKVTDQEIKGDIRILLQNAQTLTTILNDILDITKVESGQLKLEKIPFQLQEQMDTCCTLHKIPAQEKGLEFKAEYCGFDKNTSILGDPTRLRQIAHNLLSNAIKFTSKGLVALKVELKGQGAGKQVILTVSDTGIGIPVESQTGLFKPFYQGDSSTFRKFGGTGLGLSVIKSIVEAMGGSIIVSSEVNVGTTFEVTVPVELVVNTAINTKPADYRVSPKHILIVDDMPLNLMVLNKLLTHDGHQVQQAGDGHAAIELASKDKFDLIFLDISMPDLDGYETARLIRSSGGASALTPIVALSGHAFDEDVQSALDSGMNAHLSKPLDVDKVRLKIRELT